MNIEISRIYGLMLRAKRKQLSLSEEAVARALDIKLYAVRGVELCLNLSPNLWKRYATAMLRLYDVSTWDQLPHVSAPPAKSFNNRHILAIERLVKLVDVAYDIYPMAGNRAIVDFIGFTSTTDLHEAIDKMKTAQPDLRVRIYSERLIIVSFI